MPRLRCCRCCTRCTPSRGRQRRSPFSCSAPGPSARGQAAPPRPSLSPSVGVTFSPASSPVFHGGAAPANYFAASWWCGAGFGPTTPRAHATAEAHVQRRFSPTGPIFLPAHPPGLAMLSGRQYSRPGSPAGSAPRGEEHLQRSNMGAALCVRHFDTSSRGRTRMQQPSSLALRIERVQKHVPVYRPVGTKYILIIIGQNHVD